MKFCQSSQAGARVPVSGLYDVAKERGAGIAACVKVVSRVGFGLDRGHGVPFVSVSLLAVAADFGGEYGGVGFEYGEAEAVRDFLPDVIGGHVAEASATDREAQFAAHVFVAEAFGVSHAARRLHRVSSYKVKVFRLQQKNHLS